MQKALVFTLMLTYPFFSANAECDAGSKTVFACQTAKGKLLQVCDAGKTIVYSFGQEIVVRVPRDNASTAQWHGIGRYLSYAIDIPNGNTVYSVFWGADRITEEHKIEAGVNVEINQQLAATVKCNSKKAIIQNIEGIELKPSE